MKRAERAFLTILFLGAISLPFAIVFGGGFAFNGMSIAVRLLALSAFTLIFVQIITGALMQPLRKIFRPKHIWDFHRWTGQVAFALVVGHAYLVLGFGVFKAGSVRVTFRNVWDSYDALHRTALVLGIVNLSLIFTTVVTALLMKTLRNYWRQIHYLNYLIFALVIFHGLLLGTDTGASWLVKSLFIVYAALAAVALIWRWVLYSRRRASRGQRRLEGAPAGGVPPA